MVKQNLFQSGMFMLCGKFSCNATCLQLLGWLGVQTEITKRDYKRESFESFELLRLRALLF